jgi:O-acetyl-ADP-ribose deacetylase (regulator of RNase III)
MGTYKEVNGDLIKLASNGEFDVIVQGCNCQNVQRSGLAPQMVKVFGTDSFKMESPEYKGDINKLGTIDFQFLFQEKPEFGGKWVVYPDGLKFLKGKQIIVINLYSQYSFATVNNPIPIDYEALTLGLRKINHLFKGKHIGLPLIGCGLAGGDEQIIIPIIKKELKDMDVTLVRYKK